MKIKKQLLILCLIIILTPLFFSVFIFIHNYKSSPKRVFFSKIEDLTSINKDKIPENDLEKLKKILGSTPSNIDFLIFSEESSILISNFPELQNINNFSNNIAIEIINNTSKDYLYQITNIESNTHTYTYITRILKSNQKLRKFNKLDFTLWGIALFYFFCIFLIFKLSRTITKSIDSIKEKTQDLADGNLTIKIENENLKYKNEITSITESLEIVRKSLLDAQHKKNKIIMGVSHDLRTPVAVIKGYTEALKDNIIVDKNEEEMAIDLILSKTNQLETMIDTLINYIKINTSTFKESFTETNLLNFLNPILNEFLITAGLYKRKFIKNIDIKENCIINMNTNLFLRVLENLYNNAIRYSKEGDEISINITELQDKIQIEVKDTGQGINEEDLNNIFDIFYRGSNSRQEEGMGIGLSIVYDVIKLHSWSISATSKKNEGSCFTIEIPLLKA